MKGFFQIVWVVLFFGCQNNSQPTGNMPSAPQVLVEKIPMDNFELINSKSERIGQNINTMELYVPKGTIDIEALKALCRKRKSGNARQLPQYSYPGSAPGPPHWQDSCR